ncbi:hypothetical protein D9M68_709860 [compost metagenome]
MGSRGGRLHAPSVCREAPAHPGRDQRGRAGHAGVHPAPVRPRAAEPRRAARRGLYPRHAEPAGRRDPARRQWRADRAADRAAQRDHSVRHPGQGAETGSGHPAQFHASFHAGAEPAGRDQRDRRRGRFPELSRGLPDHREAARGRPAHVAAGLQPVHAEAQAGARGLPELGQPGAARPGRRPVSPQRRGRDAGLFRRGLRGFPPAAARDAAQHGGRPGACGPAAGRAALALADACHL